VARRRSRPRDGRQSNEHFGARSRLLKQVCSGDVGQALRAFEVAVRAGTAGVNDASRDALVVEMAGLLSEGQVLDVFC
jgi:hypothetical protein